MNHRLTSAWRGVEHRGVFLAQAGQRGDGEEPPVAAQPVPPADQPVVLTVVHLAPGARAGARGDREGQIAEPQDVTVDGQIVDIVVGTQTGNTIRPSGSSVQSMSK